MCILAGAGSGKTTTITRRIAAQVATGTFRASEVLAVTFTDKAAGEMRERLAALGVEGVRARTFHSAAASQLHHLAPEPFGSILPSKAPALVQLARKLPKPYRFRPAGDLATEIEWAKNRRVDPESYLDSLGAHRPPVPPELMRQVWRDYEREKSRRGLVDFEDLLGLAIRLFETDGYALERFQERYLAFTVDEYQDVNPLQQALLERWVGERDDLCVVGDDHQAIYSFTGASAQPLLRMQYVWPRAKVVKLETNYRSTPEVLALANMVGARLGGRRKVLRSVAPPGPPVAIEAFASPAEETARVVERIRALRAEQGVAFSDIAVLYRANHRSVEFEEALLDAGVPFVVRDGGFLQRPAARRMLTSLRRSRATGVAGKVRAAAERDGWIEDATETLGERELTRQRDLARLVRLAEELDTGGLRLAGFVEEVEGRFGASRDRGVNLLTLHRAKGLEFDAVFLPRLQEGELPFKRALGEEALAEERRLFYVGITRARRHLWLSWTERPGQRPSRFLEELAVAKRGRPPAKEARADPAVRALKEWRRKRAQRDGVPAYVVMHDSTLEAIASRRPREPQHLSAVPGIGPVRIERYGAEIVSALARCEDAGR